MTTSRSRLLWSSIAVAVAILAPVVQVRADVLASYPFNSSSFTSTDANPNSVATNMTIGTGLSGSSAAGAHTAFSASQGNPAPAPFVRIPGTTSTEAGAVADDDYYSFTITPQAGWMLNLESLNLDTAETDGGPSFTGTIFVRSSLDNFAATLGTWTQASFDTGTSPFTPRTVDLTGSSFQGLTTAATFRIYFYDNSDATGDPAAVHRIDNVTLNGAAVPEPGTSVLLALAGLYCGSRRRRPARV